VVVPVVVASGEIPVDDALNASTNFGRNKVWQKSVKPRGVTVGSDGVVFPPIKEGKERLLRSLPKKRSKEKPASGPYTEAVKGERRGVLALRERTPR
jgi:hypothetical protein